MTAMQVIEPGLFTTVQDLGREGFGLLGVSASGAADALALRIGNGLVGNAEGAAGLEMTLVGGAFLFSEDATVALAGSDFGAHLDGQGDGDAVEMWTAVVVRAGKALRVGATRSGARCYLCVRGGIAVKHFLGSASTHVLSGLGGYEGRALRKGDLLKIGGAKDAVRLRRLSERGRKMIEVRKSLRVTAGPQSEWFGERGLKAFCENTYRVSEESNRMGLRLVGEALRRLGGTLAGVNEMISEGVALGAVQVPESGMPIILFVEQQTTGGYPKIANVITADFSSLGQLRPRDEVRFELVDFAAARKLLLEQEEFLASEELLCG
jgi:antagonist of KipI